MAESDVETKPSAVEADIIDWASTGLKLDPHGFPLNPQPSNDPKGASPIPEEYIVHGA